MRSLRRKLQEMKEEIVKATGEQKVHARTRVIGLALS